MRGELVGVAWLLGLGSGLALPLDRAAAQGVARLAEQQSAEGARAVVAAVVRAAEVNARLPLRTDRGAKPPFRRTGDDLTEFYVRRRRKRRGNSPRKRRPVPSWSGSA